MPHQVSLFAIPLTLHSVQGELRILDTDLAKRLGFANPLDIRKLIRRHENKLKEFSILKVITKTSSEQGGRPAKEYYLTQNQAIFLCMKSETSKAVYVQIEIVKTFSSHLQVLATLRSLDEFEVPEYLPDMFVYAIQEQDTGNIKLGISRDPHPRLKQLQTGNSSTLELLAYRKAEQRFKDEHALHAKAPHYHIRGEWFTAPALSYLN